jgi:hypothetical protein
VTKANATPNGTLINEIPAHTMTQSETSSDQNDPMLSEGLVHGADALAQAVTALLLSARRHVRLFAPHLEPSVFQAASVTGAMARFAAQHAHNRAHILIEDVAQVRRDNGRLIELARRVSDAVALREVEENDRGARDLFLLADRATFLMQEDVGRSDGVVSARAPQEAAQLIARFDEIWERATPVALRTLGL